MKIVFTVHTYYPKKDGVSMVTQYLAEGLAQKGHSVIVITKTNEKCPIKEERAGVKIRRLDVNTVHSFNKGNKKEYVKYLLMAI